MAMLRGDDGRECVVLKPKESFNMEEFAEAVNEMAMVELVPVVFCRNCARCKVYGDGHSFNCMENDIDYYAPKYDADTFFCGDGKRRTANDQSD